MILSALIQLPIQLYFLYIIEVKPFKVEFTIQLILTILIFLQILIGQSTMQRITKLKAQQFDIQNVIAQYKNRKTIKKT